MGYVCQRTMKVNGATVQPGVQIDTATVDAWTARDAMLNDGSIRYVDDAEIAQYITDWAAGAVTFAESVSRPDRSIQAQRIAQGKEVR